MALPFDRSILETVAKKANLIEGQDSVRLILREIYRAGAIGTKSLARLVRIPIPTIAAVRKELEAVGLIARNKKGAILTERGLEYVMGDLGIAFLQNLTCSNCSGTGLSFPEEFNQVIVKQKEFADRRPKPLTNLDQAFGTPATALRRAYFMLQNDDLEGREILLLGDDDLTSLAISLLETSARVAVVDIDDRLLDLISSLSEENDFKISCLLSDLRDPLPRKLLQKFDVVFTDPPYTISGLNLFLSRAIEGLKPEAGRSIYLAFTHRPPTQLLEVQSAIISQGLVIQQMIPGFNRYEGAEMHANTTFLAVLETTKRTKATISGKFTGKIYTGELFPTVREYRCKEGHIIPVGLEEEIKSIEDLKEFGCPICGNKESFTRVSRRRIR